MAILIAKKKMLDRVGLSYPTVWQRMREGTFPRPVRISEGPNPQVRWFQEEVDAWVANRPRQVYKAVPTQSEDARRKMTRRTLRYD